MGKSFLPKEFKFSHEYCFFLHDQLVETLKSGEKADIFSTNVKLKNRNELRSFKKLSGEELVEWLEKNGYKSEVYVLYYKQICAALLSDFLHFVYEALQCSKKGKLTVSYALIRKPFKDNLFYLEWLLAKSEDFLSRFDSDNTERFSLPTNVLKDKRIEIIGQAIKKTKYGQWLDPQFLYEIRYEKKATYGLEPYWQKANHLFTNFKYLETERANFNFVFSSNESKYTQWKGLYSFLPILLFHSVQIIESLLSNFATRACAGNDITPIRTYIGMILWMQRSPLQIPKNKFEKEIKMNFKNIKIDCRFCRKCTKVGKRVLEQIYSQGKLKCSHCGKNI